MHAKLFILHDEKIDSTLMEVTSNLKKIFNVTVITHLAQKYIKNFFF